MISNVSYFMMLTSYQRMIGIIMAAQLHHDTCLLLLTSLITGMFLLHPFTSIFISCYLAVTNLCTIYNTSGRVVSVDTNSSRRREFVSLIQCRRKCCKWLIKLVDLVTLFRNYFSNIVKFCGENQS